MKVLTIIVTYNRKELLEECIQALSEQKNATTDILVIDNNSNDGTEQMIKEKFPNVYYENTHANLGGAGGFNFGIKKSFDLEKKYDYLWIMDDDTIPNNDSLYEILKIAQTDKNIGFISPKTIWKDGTLCLMNKQSNLENKMINEDTPNMEKLIRCTFVACFININVILDVGLPIKDFFIWSDDTEYTQRISNKYNCYYAKNSIVVHKMNNNLSVNIASDSENRIDRYYYLFRNKFYIARLKGLWGYIWYHLYIMKNIIRVLFKAKKYKIKRIKVIFKGYIAGWSFRPEIEKIN